MIKPGDGRAASVITLRTPAVIIQETLSEIRASFPGWHVWHDTWWSGTWNAHREDRKPYFGPVPDGAPVFMVCAHSAPALVALLERQTLIDMGTEFPGWRIRRTGSGGWYAFACGPYGVRVIQDLAITPLRDTLRALTRQRQPDEFGQQHLAGLEHMT